MCLPTYLPIYLFISIQTYLPICVPLHYLLERILRIYINNFHDSYKFQQNIQILLIIRQTNLLCLNSFVFKRR